MCCFRSFELMKQTFQSVTNNIIDKSKVRYFFWFLIIILTLIALRIYFLHQNVNRPISWLLMNENENESDKQIPSIVHFVIGQRDQKAAPNKHSVSSSFSFINYLTFLAARRQLRPKKLYVHYYEEPNTFWWNQMKQDSEINITLVKSRLVENIFMKSVSHFAHRADILRLEVILEYGGIYLDIDVLTLRSFDSLLNLSDVVMAHQDDDENTACNAVIIGKKHALFLKRLYDSYQSFNPKCWSCHSVRIPGQLALLYPNEVIVLPANTFFHPRWTESNRFFASNDYNFSSNYASHLWNTVNNNRLRQLTPNKILNGKFTLARMLLQAIGSDTLQILEKNFSSTTMR